MNRMIVGSRSLALSPMLPLMVEVGRFILGSTKGMNRHAIQVPSFVSSS